MARYAGKQSLRDLRLDGVRGMAILLDTRRNSTYAFTFHARRTLRIFPLYYAVLTFFIVIAPRLPFLAGLDTAWSGSNRPVEYSYGLYLLHLPVAIALGQWFPVAALVRHFTIGQLAYSSMANGASYALARLSWLVLESPILAWKRYFPYQR